MPASAAVLAAIAYLRSTMKHRKAEQYQAEELMQVVLKRLQDQVRRNFAAIGYLSRC